MKGVSIQTLRSLAHARALFFQVVDVVHQRPDFTAYGCASNGLNHALLTHTDYPASSSIQYVINIYLTLDNAHARQGAGIYTVQILPEQGRLDNLQILGHVIN